MKSTFCHKHLSSTEQKRRFNLHIGCLSLISRFVKSFRSLMEKIPDLNKCIVYIFVLSGIPC